MITMMVYTLVLLTRVKINEVEARMARSESLTFLKQKKVLCAM